MTVPLFDKIKYWYVNFFYIKIKFKNYLIFQIPNYIHLNISLKNKSLLYKQIFAYFIYYTTLDKF